MTILNPPSSGGLDTSKATATAADILYGKTAGIGDEIVTGTMTNRGAVSQALNCGGSYTIPAGYHNGSGKVTANTLASQTSATATASQILSGKTAYVNGSKITGTIASLGATTYTPTTSNQTIASGKYLSGDQTIKGDSNLVASNIKSGTSIFGVTGNYGGDNVINNIGIASGSGTGTTIEISCPFTPSNAKNVVVYISIYASINSQPFGGVVKGGESNVILTCNYYVSCTGSCSSSDAKATIKAGGSLNGSRIQCIFVEYSNYKSLQIIRNQIMLSSTANLGFQTATISSVNVNKCIVVPFVAVSVAEVCSLIACVTGNTTITYAVNAARNAANSGINMALVIIETK